MLYNTEAMVLGVTSESLVFDRHREPFATSVTLLLLPFAISVTLLLFASAEAFTFAFLFSATRYPRPPLRQQEQVSPSRGGDSGTYGHTCE